MQKKIGPLLLSGLIIGPILGSGILIIPPIVYEVAKDWAFLAWIIIICVSFFFAFIFGFLSIQFPGDGGVANAVEHALGIHIKRLTSFYLILGVVFGPVAVLMTSAQYIDKLNIVPSETIGYILLFLCVALLLKKISFVGKIAFIISLVSSGILFLGGITTIFFHWKNVSYPTDFDSAAFGYSLLLLFWTIFGWEVIGNYSANVKNPSMTITKAIIISALTIAIVELTVGASIQFCDTSSFSTDNLSITTIIYPIFGETSNITMAFLTFFLCSSTYLLYVGGVARLMTSFAEEKVFPSILAKQTSNDVPIGSILLFFSMHFGLFVLVGLGIFNLEKLVSLTNCFLLSNALIGILAGMVLLQHKILKICAAILATFFLGILLFSSTALLEVNFIIATFFIAKQLLYTSKGRMVRDSVKSLFQKKTGF